jgi:hypothetical protein
VFDGLDADMTMADRIHRTVQTLVLVAGVTAACSIVATSLNRDLYFHYPGAEWKYPTAGVAIFIGAVALETVGAWWVFGVTTQFPVWPRALLVLAPPVLWGIMLAQAVIHAPRFYLAHLVWVWCLIIAMGVTALVSGGTHAYTLLRRRVG